MKNFRYGPFSFEQGESRIINTVPHTEWLLYYGPELLRRATLQDGVNSVMVVDSMKSGIEEIQQRAIRRAAEINCWVELERCADEETLASFRSCNISDLGLTFRSGIPYEWEMLARISGTNHIAPCNVAEFVTAASLAKTMHWQTALLPSEVLTEDPDEWRPPTAWEIRHIVGEGSFTGISGAKAAHLVGITPINMRRYIADEGAKNKQNISFSSWHLLLQKLLG